VRFLFNKKDKYYILLTMYNWVWIYLGTNSIQENSSLGTLF